MQYGPYQVDYEYRPYNPERMRKERVARAQASLKKHGLGAMILYDYDYHRYLGYYSFHQYARRRLGTFVLLVRDQGLPYVPIDHLNGQWERPRMPWFEGKMVLKTSKAYQLIQGLPEHPEFPLRTGLQEWTSGPNQTRRRRRPTANGVPPFPSTRE